MAKIEELFSDLDKGIESLKTAREQLKVYRQAVLKHAFEGKLTADWRKENEGEEIRGIDFDEIDSSELDKLPAISKAWQYVRLANLGELGRRKVKAQTKKCPRIIRRPISVYSNWGSEGGQPNSKRIQQNL